MKDIEDPFSLNMSREDFEKLCEIADKMERVNPISPSELRAALKRVEEMKEGNIDDG